MYVNKSFWDNILITVLDHLWRFIIGTLCIILISIFRKHICVTQTVNKHNNTIWFYPYRGWSRYFDHFVTSFILDLNSHIFFFGGGLGLGFRGYSYELELDWNSNHSRNFTLQHQFLPFFYVKSWSNLTPNGGLKICSLWQFQSTCTCSIRWSFGWNIWG